MMETRQLHAIAVPERVVNKPGGGQSERVASEGALGSDVPAVESVAANAGEQRLAGIVGGQYGGLTAAEFEELFGASAISVVPYFGSTSDPQRDGYYATEDVSTERPAAQSPDLQQFDGRLRKQGTRRSHLRALRTKPSTEDNPFGTDSTEEVAIPARARRVRWFDDVDTQAVETATVQRTVEGEHDRLAVYDATEPSFADPALVYDIGYDEEWRSHCRVWDDYGRDKVVETSSSGPLVGSATVGTATVGDSTRVVTWQRVYRTDHDLVGRLVVESDRLRLVPDEGDEVLRAYRWDERDGHYEIVQLGASSWRLVDADLRRIGLARVDLQVEFEDMSSPGTTHTLNCSVKRGRDDALWLNPANEGSVPSGLVDRLGPIADTSEQDPAAQLDIVARSVVGQ